MEKRLLKFKFGENLEELGRDTVESYIKGPIDDGNYVQAGLGVPAASIRSVAEIGDALWDGALNRKYEVPAGSRIMRDVDRFGKDIWGALKNTGTLRWGEAGRDILRAGTDIVRIPTNDIPLDIIDGAGGFDIYREETRQSAQYTLAT